MQKVAEDVAVQEFDRMCSAYRVDVEESKMGEEELATWTRVKRTIVAAMCDGRLIVREDGRAVFTPKDPPKDVTAFTFNEPTLATFMAMDAAPDKPFTRLALAGTQLTASAPGTFSKLKAFDATVCLELVKLFLAAG